MRHVRQRDIASQIDTLKRDVGQLAELVQRYGEKKGDEVAHSLAAKAREFVERAGVTSSALSDQLGSLVSDPRHAIERGRAFARDEVHELEEAVSEHPLASVGWAFAAGLVVGWLCTRR
jgi:ElaB/YqjD/DUF883 family membrane-anchored ribosome-binding protein